MYNGKDKEKSAKSRFANIFSIIINPSKYVVVDTINVALVAFTSDDDTSDALIRYSWYCCISAASSYIKYTITNGDTPLVVFTEAALFPISGAIHSIFPIVFTKIGYSGTSVS